jgi:hypothetical protein
MQSRVSWFNRAVTGIRTAGAANTLWIFVKSPMAAIYLWGPLLTLWGFIGGLRQDVQIPYLLAACILIFGGTCWSALHLGNLRDRFKDRYDKLNISYNRNVPSCRADVTFGDRSHSICFRLEIQNNTSVKLDRCEGYLVSIDRFPNISPVKLFWVGASLDVSMSADLIKGVPRFLQICRISDKGQVIVATENETWPIDSLNSFHPGTYVFKVAVKGKDKAETSFYSIELNWTGNWTTAEMRPLATT